MAGTAGPGHLKARHGDDVRLRGVEVRNGGAVSLPLRAAGVRHPGGIVKRIGGVCFRLAVKIVGVVGEGQKVDVGALGQGGDMLQRSRQRSHAVGIIAGVTVELAEVELAGIAAHHKAPADPLHPVGQGAVRPVSRAHRHGGPPQRKLLLRGVAVKARVRVICRVDLRSVYGHVQRAQRLGALQMDGDRRAAFRFGPAVRGGRRRVKLRAAVDYDGGAAADIARIAQTQHPDQIHRAVGDHGGGHRRGELPVMDRIIRQVRSVALQGFHVNVLILRHGIRLQAEAVVPPRRRVAPQEGHRNGVRHAVRHIHGGAQGAE